ncbi:MAG: hypothetical protein VB118_05365 [Oscillospiraceae bacterium]|nr:hypothetical protein [Oscillospiraceae bacterium]
MIGTILAVAFFGFVIELCRIENEERNPAPHPRPSKRNAGQIRNSRNADAEFQIMYARYLDKKSQGLIENKSCNQLVYTGERYGGMQKCASVEMRGFLERKPGKEL